jgi:asparagine synthase (glutamine-hydrolysing)
MSAIFGVVRYDGGDAAGLAEAMERQLRRYGPDGRTSWGAEAGDVALGAVHYHTLPEDGFDDRQQIMQGDRYVVMSDVRLTERDDLAAALGLDREAKALSDRALVAAAIDRWDEDAFRRIYGDFAVTAWDPRHRRLLLARDHIGRRPLHMHAGSGFFAFASLPSALHALPGVEKAADLDEIGRALRFLPPTPGRTVFKGIGRVNPGHYAVVEDGRVRQTRYFEPDLSPLRFKDPAEYTEALRERLERAVAATLRGVDDAVAAQLSAGFDSTAVVTTAARQLAGRGARVVAFTAAPRPDFVAPAGRETIADESIVAAETARMHHNIDHVVVRGKAGPLGGLDRLVAELGTLPADLVNQSWSDAINTEARRRGLRIMLEAGWGNQTISDTGMRALHELARAGRLPEWVALVVRLRRGGTTGWRGAVWNTVEPWLPDGVYRWYRHLRGKSVLPIETASPLSGSAWIRATDEERREAAERHPMDRGWFEALDRDVRDTRQGRLAPLPYDIAPFDKLALGTYGIDNRDPTSDRRLFEFSLRVPVEEMIRDGRPRHMLRSILEGQAPASVLESRKRGHQGADWELMIDEDWDAISGEIERLDPDSIYGEILDTERLKKLVADWPNRTRSGSYDIMMETQYRYTLTRALATIAFIRKTNGLNS